jgi:hypothetical protein
MVSRESVSEVFLPDDNDFTEAVFAEHQLSIPEMFHIISKM